MCRKERKEEGEMVIFVYGGLRRKLRWTNMEERRRETLKERKRVR